MGHIMPPYFLVITQRGFLLMRDGSGQGWAGYIWSGVTAFFTWVFAWLTPQDLIFAIGAVISAMFAYLTYKSNNKRNERLAAAAEARNELLKTKLSARRSINPENVPDDMRELVDLATYPDTGID